MLSPWPSAAGTGLSAEPERDDAGRSVASRPRFVPGAACDGAVASCWAARRALVSAAATTESAGEEKTGDQPRVGCETARVGAHAGARGRRRRTHLLRFLTTSRTMRSCSLGVSSCQLVMRESVWARGGVRVSRLNALGVGEATSARPRTEETHAVRVHDQRPELVDFDAFTADLERAWRVVGGRGRRAVLGAVRRGAAAAAAAGRRQGEPLSARCGDGLAVELERAATAAAAQLALDVLLGEHGVLARACEGSRKGEGRGGQRPRRGARGDADAWEG